MNRKTEKKVWKFNKSLFPKDECTSKLRKIISESLSILDPNGIRDDQIRWEYMKFEMRQFSITFSKNLSKLLNAKREILEKEPKDFKKFSSSYSDNEDCLACKTKVDKNL